MSDRDLFGIADFDLVSRWQQQFVTWPPEQLPAVLDDTLGRASAYMSEALETGRWRFGRPDPARYVPGDVNALKALAVMPQLRLAIDRARSSHPDDAALSHLDVATSRTVLDAPAFFMTADHAHHLMAMDPPPEDWVEDLALPFPQVAVLFDRDMPLADGLVATPDEMGAAIARRRARGGPLGLSGRTLTEDVDMLGGYVTGIIIHAGANGTGLSDHVIFILATNPDPAAPPPANLDRVRGFVVGNRHRSRLAAQIANLAAGVASLDWVRPPAGPDLPTNDRERRRALRHNRFRRAETAGGYVDVHVVALRPPGHGTEDGEDNRTGTGRASPRPHRRRGHWKRVAVGEGRRERRLVRIGPVVVNAHHDAPVADQVWVVPDNPT